MISRSNQSVVQDEMDALLRESPPVVECPVGLEVRIMHAVGQDGRGRELPVKRWLAAAAAVVLMILSHQSGEVPVNPQPVANANHHTADEPLVIENPLRHEAMALRRDVDRTGRFLLDALPSLSLAEP